MEDLKLGLTFDDVALVPYFSNLKSRTEPLLKTRLTRNCEISTPIIASNMESVIGDNLADILLDYGSMPIFHRFTENENTIINWINKYENKCFISWGVINLDNLFKILDKCNDQPKGICFDVAHGHTDLQRDAIKAVKNYNQSLEVIAGNVCSKTAIHDVSEWGADAVRVGVGNGSACSTRLVTGFGVPQFTAIRDCSYVAKQRNLPLIADGGIRNSRDCILALAAGAETVMIGGLFAATNESAAIKKDGKALYRGQASAAFQRQGLAPEGEEGWIGVTGSASDLISILHSQLRSGLSYGGARSIEELQRHAKFIKVTPAYMQESKVRI